MMGLRKYMAVEGALDTQAQYNPEEFEAWAKDTYNGIFGRKS
jgi:hypothetical protein